MSSQPSLRSLFEAALALPAAERAAFVAASCPDPEVRDRLLRLLSADGDAEGPLPARDAADLAAAIGDADEAQYWQPDQCIGPYRLGEKLGAGGSAEVFRAWRDLDGTRQVVALKLLRRSLHSPEARRLFRRERKALAVLAHPDIAHLIDGGVAEGGQAYLAMEYVDGVAITRFADENALGLSERLRLMIRVCRAVAVAHRNLIVHRDLKPSNVLVTEDGQVKLLDFGIAKLLDEELTGSDPATGTGWAALTPGYAAPEQYSGGPVSTATDVYALGIVLLEILQGEQSEPCAGVAKGRPVQRAESSARVLSPMPRGDLGTILRKALAEEPERRYASAADLAEDLERYLRAEPVRAHPPSTWYRARKFVRRHAGSVVVAAVLAIGLSASLAFSMLQLIHARDQAQLARQEAARANASRDLLLSIVESARVRLPRDRRMNPEDLVLAAQRELGFAPGLDQGTRAELDRTLGEVLLSLGAYADVVKVLERARAANAKLADPAWLLAIDVSIAEAQRHLGKDREALAYFSDAIPVLAREQHPSLARALAAASVAALAVGQHEQALAWAGEASALALDNHGEFSEEALAARIHHGALLARLQRPAEAEPLLAAAIESWRSRHEHEDARLLSGLGSLVAVRHALGQGAEAVPLARELLELQRRVYPAQHEAIAHQLRDIATMLLHSGSDEEIEALLGEALEIQRKTLGAGHRETATTLDTLGTFHAQRRRFVEAADAFQEAISACDQGELRDEVCARARNSLGMTYYRQEQLDEAERWMAEALAMRRDLMGPEHPTVAYSLSTLANLAVKRQQPHRAVALSGEALAILEAAGLAQSREAALIGHGYAQALRVAGDHAGSRNVIDRVIATWRLLEPDSHTRLALLLTERAQAEAGQGDLAAARQSLAEVDALPTPRASLPESTRAILTRLADELASDRR